MIRLSATACALALALSALGLSACGGPAEEKPSTPPAGSTPGKGMGAATIEDMRTALPMKEIMGHVVDFAAFGVWNNQGWIIDADGTHELFPTTDKGWLDAESAALTLAEISNILMLPNRPPDEDRRWVDNAHKLYDAAIKTQAAAEKKDKQAFFDAGGEIYDACTQCHAHYVQGDEPGPDATLPPLPNRTPPPT